MANRFSRREFLKGVGLVLGGAVSGVTGVSAVLAAGGTLGATPRARGHIIQLAPEESACTGCATCELVCAAAHGNLVGPSRRRIWLEREGFSPVFRVLTCQQCDYPACYYACPRKDRALCIDAKTHARFIDFTECESGCQECLKACTSDPARINFDAGSQAALMCDLCKDREQGPACVEFCPSLCLQVKEHQA